MFAEDHGVPAVTLVTPPFESLARNAARGKGSSDPRVVVVPYEYQVTPSEDALRRIGREAFEAIVRTMAGAEDGRPPASRPKG